MEKAGTFNSVDELTEREPPAPAGGGSTGNLCFGIWKDRLIVRMDREQGEKSLKYRNVKPFDITGRPTAGWVMVEKAGWKSAAGLATWMGIGKEFALSLPEKKGKAKKKRT